MNYFLRLSIIALSFFIIVHSSYAGWDDLELKDGGAFTKRET